MMRQRELARAFFSFEPPDEASNMEIREIEGGAILVGADEYVHAIRAPLDSILVFDGYPRYSRESTISRGWVHNQNNKVVQVAREHPLAGRESIVYLRPARLSDDGIEIARHNLHEHTSDAPAPTAF